MNALLCITIRFLAPRTHGRGEDDLPEWPPSPLRLIQALVAAASGRWNERTSFSTAASALCWLENQPPPFIIAPLAVSAANPTQFYVPDNTADLIVPRWRRGDLTAQVNRSEKIVKPNHLSDAALHYLFPMDSQGQAYFDLIKQSAQSMTHLGWGIDHVVADAAYLDELEIPKFAGIAWEPTSGPGVPLRVPKTGTLDDLMRKHSDFLGRITPDGFRPVPPLRVFDIVNYRRQDEPQARPYRVFELRTVDGDRYRHPPSKAICLAGMVRHLAIEAMKVSPPPGVGGDWVGSYVAGHFAKEGEVKPSADADPAQAGSIDPRRHSIRGAHRQLSYLPLPSIGHAHADPGIRRVMIAAPVGDDDWLEHVGRRLAGQQLRPLRGDEFGEREPPLLIPIRHDNVIARYTQAADTWHSVTPVILPGYDDRRPAKTRKLIEKALAQSGIDQPCKFEWSAFSRFAKSHSAHSRDRDGNPTGYRRPRYLENNAAIHLTIYFGQPANEQHSEQAPNWIPAQIPGPLAIGAGRHCGLGIFASLPRD